MFNRGGFLHRAAAALAAGINGRLVIRLPKDEEEEAKPAPAKRK